MYTAVYKKGRSGYIAWVEEVPGVNTQGTTKSETRENLGDALKEFVAARRMMTKKHEGVVRERIVMA